MSGCVDGGGRTEFERGGDVHEDDLAGRDGGRAKARSGGREKKIKVQKRKRDLSRISTSRITVSIVSITVSITIAPPDATCDPPRCRRPTRGASDSSQISFITLWIHFQVLWTWSSTSVLPETPRPTASAPHCNYCHSPEFRCILDIQSFSVAVASHAFNTAPNHAYHTEHCTADRHRL